MVTGGAGFIGSHVVDTLLRQSDTEVVVVDNLSHGQRRFVNPAARFIQGDVLDWGVWVDEVGPVDAVIHLAAQISVPESEAHPENDVRQNVLGTVAMLQAAKRLKAREFRFASSAAVYGDDPHLPLAEERAGQTLSYYGLDKWIGETYIAYEALHSSLIGTVLRLANVYGPRQRTQGEGGVVAVFAEALAQGAKPQIFGDGEQTRDFIAVQDVARAFCHRLGDPASGGVRNIATGEAVSINEVWLRLASIAGLDDRDIAHGPERPGDIRHSLLDTARARAWGFQAHVDLNVGLAMTYQYFREDAGVL
nr:NAD-dependent epimerase/dehydratase family protein [Sulfobacillus harzensis]